MNTTELRALAEAATPGPWIEAGPSFGAKFPVVLNSVVQNIDDDPLSICDNFENAEDCSFVAAANPAAVIALLDEIERLTAERNTCGSGAGCLHKDALIESLTAERDELRVDAQRYRWLRKTTNWVSSKGHRIDVRESPELWDESIDAAMKGQP